MKTFDQQVKELYEQANIIIQGFFEAEMDEADVQVHIPENFKKEFFSLVDKVNLSLMEDKDNFYGYFLFQMMKEIRFDMSSQTGVNFKNAKYTIYFNPIIFLTLNIKQMESTIKHEVLHILSRHLIRAKDFKCRYSTIAINTAMDIVVNRYLDYLPPYASTLERVNNHYNLQLQPYEPFEYYVEKLQVAIDLLDENEDSQEDDRAKEEQVEQDFIPEKTHDIWEESQNIDEKTMQEFTENFINNAQKGSNSAYLDSIIATFKNNKGELPWHIYLKRLMGYVESNKKKTITRRNRRQPERLDLRGELRDHKAKIIVGLDISGSISDEEFKQGIREVLTIVKNYKHEITIVECDDEIRRIYPVKSIKDMKDRPNIRGGTKFTPVFEYANNKKANLLIYFTDGKGEERLKVTPKGYKILWVISGNGDGLSVKESYGVVKKLKHVEIKRDSLELKDVIIDGYSMNNQERIR